MALRLRGPLNREALVRTLTRIIRRHSALRTRLMPGKDGQLVQVILPAPKRFPLVDEDLSQLPKPKQMPAVELSWTAEAIRPFDLTRGLRLRCRLLRLASDDHVLLYNVHPIVADHLPTGLFAEELGRLYGVYEIGRAHV